MNERCPTMFDEKLLSGFLDGELTQGAEQRVRLHLAACTHCRALLEELTTIREATMSTEFVQPRDDQWDERPRGATSRLSRSVGWVLAVVWLTAVTGFTLWHVWQSPEGLFFKLLVFGGLAAFALLFLSILVDRIRTARTDRYSEVDR